MVNHSEQEAQYQNAATEFGPHLQRISRSTEANRERQRDLLHDIHIALWQSSATFDGSCSLRTWVYRIAHNTAASYVYSERSHRAILNSVDEIDQIPDALDLTRFAEKTGPLEHLHTWIRQLRPIDRRVLTLYLEDLDATTIAEIAGSSPGAVTTRISRLKAKLVFDFKEARHV